MKARPGEPRLSFFEAILNRSITSIQCLFVTLPIWEDVTMMECKSFPGRHGSELASEFPDRVCKLGSSHSLHDAGKGHAEGSQFGRVFKKASKPRVQE